jgi:hypothetical protein
MANSFTSVGFDPRAEVCISNAGTSVFILTLILGASDIAKTGWEQDLAAWLASRDQTILGSGMAGFDLSEIAWSTDSFQAEHGFLIALVDRAIDHHRWDEMELNPQWTPDYLRDFRTLVAEFHTDLIKVGQRWDPEPPDPPVMCAKHLVYEYRYGCVICRNQTS